MTDNKMVREKLHITHNLDVSGNIYIVKNSESLNNIDNIESYELISGEMDNLTINGNLIICVFEWSCDMVVNGNVTSNGEHEIN